MTNILIIGGGGFIGKNIVEKIIDLSNSKITLLLRKPLKKNYDENDRITIIEGSLHNTDLIERIIVAQKIDYIIHLVSTLIPSSSLVDFNEEMINIIIPTYKLLEIAAKNNIKILFFSSGGTVYCSNSGNI